MGCGALEVSGIASRRSGAEILLRLGIQSHDEPIVGGLVVPVLPTGPLMALEGKNVGNGEGIPTQDIKIEQLRNFEHLGKLIHLREIRNRHARQPAGDGITAALLGGLEGADRQESGEGCVKGGGASGGPLLEIILDHRPVGSDTFGNVEVGAIKENAQSIGGILRFDRLVSVFRSERIDPIQCG